MNFGSLRPLIFIVFLIGFFPLQGSEDSIQSLERSPSSIDLEVVTFSSPDCLECKRQAEEFGCLPKNVKIRKLDIKENEGEIDLTTLPSPGLDVLPKTYIVSAGKFKKGLRGFFSCEDLKNHL